MDLLVIGFVGGKEGLVKQASEQFLRMLSELARTSYSQLPLRVLRPSPAAVAKMGGKYRYKLIIKCRNSPTFREMMAQLLCSFAKLRDFREVTAYADSNPYTIL